MKLFQIFKIAIQKKKFTTVESAYPKKSIYKTLLFQFVNVQALCNLFTTPVLVTGFKSAALLKKKKI